uniref:Uncharacterized protein n=1 Tax=viral metagenome TaxID=1070528 RepID=A0A6C0F3J4_9ZZZZ
MNIAYKLDQIELHNIYFLDSKKNIIMDGQFTKITYSDAFLTTNGIALLIPFASTSLDKTYNKSILKFNTADSTNIRIINELTRLEKFILDYYKHTTHNTKAPTTTLTDHIRSGNVKVYRDITSIPSNPKYVLKISGIWEDQTRIGLTYKFMESIMIT